MTAFGRRRDGQGEVPRPMIFSPVADRAPSKRDFLQSCCCPATERQDRRHDDFEAGFDRIGIGIVNGFLAGAESANAPIAFRPVHNDKGMLIIPALADFDIFTHFALPRGLIPACSGALINLA